MLVEMITIRYSYVLLLQFKNTRCYSGQKYQIQKSSKPETFLLFKQPYNFEDDTQPFLEFVH